MATSLDQLSNRFIRVFSSLRLTVTCLALGIVLVFVGTLAQVDLGLYKAQNEFFRSFLIFWRPKGASWKIPVFPGGYLIGGVLALNLITAFATRFTLDKKKIGIWVVHSGIILLLLGQLLTDMLSRESALQLFENETKNFSEDFRATELVVIDKSNPDSDLVFAIPQSKLAREGTVSDPRLPFPVRLKKFWTNARLSQPGDKDAAAGVPSGATQGSLKDFLVVPSATVADTEERNIPAAVVELEASRGNSADFLVSALTERGQSFTLGGKPYEVALRFVRYYYPFSVTMLKATHEKYKGTEIPKNFASRVRVQNPDRNEARETVIYMNNPLRYGGLTFYQYQMSAGEAAERAGQPPSSTLQVVRNPGWVTPYVSCILVAMGLLIQFGSHLVGFVKKGAV